MLKTIHLRKFTAFARETAYEAGQMLLKMSRRRHRITLKGRVNLVTEADLASEKYIDGTIGRKYPHHSILAEEGAARDNDSEFKWIVDPLDGTTNYAHAFPFYCISIGLEYSPKKCLPSSLDTLTEESTTILFLLSSNTKQMEVFIGVDLNSFSYTILFI